MNVQKTPMEQKPVIYWFRQDLRLHDNPALCEAATQGPVLALYILDDTNAGPYTMGAASRVWLHGALDDLNRALGGALSLYQGNPSDILQHLIQRHGVENIYWNRCYEPWSIKRDKNLKNQLEAQGVTVHSHKGSLLWEPWTIKKDDGTPYKVFTPFYRKGCLNAPAPRKPLKEPKVLTIYSKDKEGLSLEQLSLRPTIPWHHGIEDHWQISEQGATQQLQTFLETGLPHYKKGRDFPDKPYVSKLSPYLHFGQISPNTVWYSALSTGDDANVQHFCSELGWREFSYHLLYANPELPKKNLQPKFDKFPWKEDAVALKAWQQGNTGIPMVDAGMRQLWQTGYMHNRVRMIVGSFLVKNLRQHWHHGERWFWDCLVDADLANNSASWQWIAGCGADAAPYFRIFNPVTQGQSFDPEGGYVRRFVPELANLPTQFLFNPWQAPERMLQGAGVTLGKTYPYPIVDLKASREEALAAFSRL